MSASAMPPKVQSSGREPRGAGELSCIVITMPISLTGTAADIVCRGWQTLPPKGRQGTPEDKHDLTDLRRSPCRSRGGPSSGFLPIVCVAGHEDAFELLVFCKVPGDGGL